MSYCGYKKEDKNGSVGGESCSSSPPKWVGYRRCQEPQNGGRNRNRQPPTNYAHQDRCTDRSSKTCGNSRINYPPPPPPLTPVKPVNQQQFQPADVQSDVESLPSLQFENGFDEDVTPPESMPDIVPRHLLRLFRLLFREELARLVLRHRIQVLIAGRISGVPPVVIGMPGLIHWNEAPKEIQAEVDTAVLKASSNVCLALERHYRRRLLDQEVAAGYAFDQLLLSDDDQEFVWRVALKAKWLARIAFLHQVKIPAAGQHTDEFCRQILPPAPPKYQHRNYGSMCQTHRSFSNSSDVLKRSRPMQSSRSVFGSEKPNSEYRRKRTSVTGSMSMSRPLESLRAAVDDLVSKLAHVLQ